MQDQADNSVADGSNASNGPDYSAVAVPSQPGNEYSYVERRAELLQLIRQAGHPSRLNQTELADRYEVSQQQISKDFDRLGEYLEENLGSRRYITTEAVIDRSIQGMLENEEYRQAARTVLDWNEWIDERQEIKEIEERITALEEQQDTGMDL